MLAMAAPTFAPFIPTFSMSHPAGTRPSRDFIPLSFSNNSCTSRGATGFIKNEPAAHTFCKCRFSRSKIVSSMSRALSSDEIVRNWSVTRVIIHSGYSCQPLPAAQLLRPHGTDKHKQVGARPRVDLRPGNTPQVAHQAHHK